MHSTAADLKEHAEEVTESVERAATSIALIGAVAVAALLLAAVAVNRARPPL